VIFGPVNQNSYEAQLLKASGGGWEIRTRSEIQTLVEKFSINEIYRLESGKKAFRVVQENAGATNRSIQVIMDSISSE
jgi:3-deoxy-D-manno-octulosonic-acid transferase